MKLKYDREADAIYVYFSRKPYAYGKELDDERHIDYALDDTLIGIELLCVSKGVNLSGLPRAKEIAQLLENSGIKIYSVENYSEINISYRLRPGNCRNLTFQPAILKPNRQGHKKKRTYLNCLVFMQKL